MTPRERRAVRAALDQIRQVLVQEWDPLGVRVSAEARGKLDDEYDSYLGRIYRLLTADAAEEKIAEYLLSVEKELGAAPYSPGPQAAASALKRLKLHLREMD